MSSATVVSIDRTQQSASDLLDVLYEILASGLEPEGTDASAAEIEAFLHQHARSPKTRPETEAFFQSHGLPMQLDSFARDSGLRLASVSPLPMMPRQAPAPFHATPITRSVVPVAPAEIATATRPNTQPWAALGVVCVALLVALVLGGFVLMNLREQVTRSDANQRALLTAIETLKTHTDQIDTRINEQAKVIASTHAQIDRLVQSFLPVTE